MNKKLTFILILLSLAISVSSFAAPPQTEANRVVTNLPFRQWLFDYIPSQYSDAKMTDHHHWMQAHITEVMVTELDIKTKRSGYQGADVRLMSRDGTNDPQAATAKTQKDLAAKYAEIFSVLLKHKQDITRVTLWGVYDGRSWIGGSPLLFDRDYQPKEAFYSVIKTGLENQ